MNFGVAGSVRVCVLGEVAGIFHVSNIFTLFAFQEEPELNTVN